MASTRRCLAEGARGAVRLDRQRTVALRDKLCHALEGANGGEALSALGMVVTAILKTCDLQDQESWVRRLCLALDTDSTNRHTRQ